MLKIKLLFICTHNSARSQMAEGIINTFYNKKYEAHSAGIEPTKINPYAIKVMKDLGIDISKHRSKSVKEFLGKNFDYVITLCDSAKGSCPFFPGGVNYIHNAFEDPSKCQGTDEEILACVSRIRDKIKKWLEITFKL